MSPTAIVTGKLMPSNHATDALTSLRLGGPLVSSSKRPLAFIAVSATRTASLIVYLLLYRN